jgi:hypothetical protein
LLKVVDRILSEKWGPLLWNCPFEKQENTSSLVQPISLMISHVETANANVMGAMETTRELTDMLLSERDS